jgi:hypothetical protein
MDDISFYINADTFELGFRPLPALYCPLQGEVMVKQYLFSRALWSVSMVGWGGLFQSHGGRECYRCWSFSNISVLPSVPLHCSVCQAKVIQ